MAYFVRRLCVYTAQQRLQLNFPRVSHVAKLNVIRITTLNRDKS